jgi:steroid delta-isomerase-like uncharacterized protein
VTAESSAELVREYFRTVWVEGQWDRVHEFVSETFVNHGSVSGMPSASIEDARVVDAQMRAVFPDIEFTLARVVAEDGLVARHWTAVATHEHEFMGIPATGRRVEMQGMVFSRIADGRITEEWRIVDNAGLLEQLRRD